MRRSVFTLVLLPLVFVLTSVTLVLSQPVFTIQNKKDACNNLANGSFDILVTSGTGNISAFIFSSGAPIGPVALTLNVPQSITGLSGAVVGRPYLIVVADDISNSVNSTTIFLLPNVSASIASTTNNATCNASNGVIDINVVGGSGVYTYAWTGSNGFTATSQDVSGLSSGTYTVIVSDQGTACTATLGPISITDPPSPTNAIVSVTGLSTICQGQTSTIKVDIIGGTAPFSVSIAGLGVINNYISGTGITVTPVSNIVYSLTSVTDANGCTSAALVGSASLTVNPTPVAPGVTFTPNVYCVGEIITPPVITTPAGGSTYTWYSDAGLTTVLTTGASPTNLQLGFSSVAANTKTIYVKETNSFNCSGPATSLTLTVNALPVVSTPTTAICVGATMTASPGTGGTWVSSNPAVATITNAGLITGVSAGTATFTFTQTTTGCSNTTTSITVNAPPIVSTPSATLCIGSTMTASPAAGGTWVSSNPAIATITNAGLITALTPGSVTFTFTLAATGCSNTTSSVTVNALPVVSTSSPLLCVGANMTASPSAGGTWVSSNPAVATIDNSGLITGLTAGSVTFTYTDTATGCSKSTSSVTVNTLPVVSTPLTALCIGSTMTASPAAGGTWVSSNPAIATITNAGLITALTPGSVTFTFTLAATGCSSTTSSVTVNALPVVSTPTPSLCIGATMTASPSAGGTWVSSNPAVATITNAGLIAGLTAGSVTFTFTETATGCSKTTSNVTVNALPVVSTPSATLCVGSAMTASPGSGGTWVSSNPTVATITNAGLIAGLTAGTVTFTFTNSTTGCSNTTSTITVNALPMVSTPSATLCIGSSMAASPVSGGTWVSSNPAVATVNNAGLITAITAGIVTFTFTETATGCSNTTSSVTVNALPIVSTPSATICAGAGMTASPATGGTWVSSNPAVATIDNAGLITGLTAGTVTFTFTNTTTGCSRTTSSVTVNTLPVVSTPAASLCAGATMTASPVTGGTWVSSNSAVATISNSGLITALTAGSVTFTFTLTATGCSNTTTSVTVNALPLVSTPAATLCAGQTMTASPVTGGTWVSSNSAVATIDNAGLITGVSAGSASFTFTLAATGCSNTTTSVTVNALPIVTTSALSICAGATMTASPVAGGTWVSSNPAIATITNAGLITAITSGNVTFTFTQTTTGCSNTTSGVTVNALPVVSTPSSTLCAGATMTASPGVGGTWISSNPSIATIDNAGLITGLTAGNVTFTYTETATGCSNTTSSVTVNALPVVSTQSTIVCIGATMTASPGSGGTWVSSNPTVATIDNTGLITGVSAGTASFTFTQTATGCSNTTATVTVNTLPTVSIPSSTLCAGATMTASPGSGGTWVSSNPLVASINNSGLITGLTAGTATFTYIETATGCINSTSAITVIELPTALLSGTTAVCNGSSASLQITFTGTGPWAFQYSDGITTLSGNSPTNSFSLSVSPSATTTYTLISVSDANCAGTILGTPATVTVDNVPLTSLAVSVTINPVCSGGSGSIQIANSETGVSYQLRNDVDDSLIGSAITGTGGNLLLSTGVLVATTTFNVLATRGVCTPVQLTSTSSVTVVVSSLDTSLGLSVQQTPICAGSGTNIQILNSESGVTYQLRDDSDDSLVGAAISGTGGTIVLPTGNLSATKVFNVLASDGTCSIELNSLATVNVDINPDPSLLLDATISPLCIGGSSAITIAGSETGVSYQLRNNADNSLVGTAVAGTGSAIELPTGVLSVSQTFNVLASSGVCTAVQLAATVLITVAGSIDLSLPVTPASATICPGFSTDFQITGSELGVNYTLIDAADNSVLSVAVTGTGAPVSITTIPINSVKNIKVLASNGSCSAHLTSIVSVSLSPSPITSLSVAAASVALCSGESTQVQILDSEVGVIYQLRDDSNDSNVSGSVFGNGGTISMPTGILTNDKTFNVLATKGICPEELLNKVTITINAAPDPGISVVAQDPLVCIGKSTFIQVINSVAGIIYQLRDNADNTIVSGASFGNGGTINLPTGPLTADRTFNVLASNVICEVQLSATVTVNLRASNDPLCSNCSTATVTPVNLTKVTCNSAVPDGSVEFLVDPPVPSINLTGVKIQITGPTPKTQTDNFVFTGLSAGNYDYTVTYGDENNPDCIKNGSFIIELSREPDPVDFDLTVNEFNCDANKGSITLTNIIGASSADFQYTVFSNGSIWDQSAISSSSTSLTVSNLLLGDYEVQLTQNQESINGCVGTVSSLLVPFTIAEPAGGCGVFIPNVFTPNGDGSNDLFVIRHLPANSSISITNRWGKEVFSSSDYQSNWTADSISDGIYYYRLIAEGKVFTGWVEILR